MNMQTIFQAIIVILPFVAFGVSYWAQRPTLATNTPIQNAAITRSNAMISGSSILSAAILTAFLQGKLTGNTTFDVGYVLTLATTLQMETFRPLQGWLRGDPPIHS